jgi:sugar-specific transcriptional regulator TrmB
MQISQLFSGLDISAEESATYLELLNSDRLTAGLVAKRLNLPRPSVYGFLERLVEKGLASQSVDMSGVREYRAEPPEKVAQLFDQRIEQLEHGRRHYVQMLEELRAARPASVAPHFQVFQGAEGVKHILKDMLLYRNLETQAFWPICSMLDILGADFFRYLNKERIRNNLATRAIWPASQVADLADHPYLGVGEGFLREIRIAESADFSLGYWIYGNRTAFISSRQEGFGFIVESAELAQTQRAQFELIWEQSKVLDTVNPGAQEFLREIR